MTAVERWKINLGVLWFGTFFVMSGMTMIIPFLPLYLQQDLGVTDERAIGVWGGAIFAGNFVTAFLFQPIWGRVADRIGRKVMLLRSGFGMGLITLLMGFATEPWHLLVLRLLNGVISGYNPAAIALMSATAPKARMGFAMGTLQSGITAGTILGPLIGGLFADAFGFRPIFYITGALLFLTSILSWVLIKENFDREKAAAQPATSMAEDVRKLLADKRLAALLGATFAFQFALLCPVAFIPLYIQRLQESMENIAFWSGFVGSVTAFSNMIFAPVLGRLGDRAGPAPVLFISLVGAALMFVPQAFAGSVGELLFYRFLLGCFVGGIAPALHTLIRSYTPDVMVSRVFGYNTSALSLGNMCGPIVGGAVFGLVDIEGLFLLSAGVLLAASVWIHAVVPGANLLRKAGRRGPGAERGKVRQADGRGPGDPQP
ncbi:MAG TPA: MFS transporter [Paenibacillaceae bacterium]